MEDFFYRWKASYCHFPLTLRNSIGRSVRLLPNCLRYGPFYTTYTQRIRKFLLVEDRTSIQALQLEMLKSTVNWAIYHVPFYKGMKPIQDFSDLVKFPIINKKDYQENLNSFIASVLCNRILPANTGGSSGDRMDFFLHKGRTRPKEKAHFDWYWGMFGYSHSSNVCILRGKPLQKRRLFERQTLNNSLNISCHDITESNIHLVTDTIKKFHPEYIIAYPSALMVFTKLLGDISTIGSDIRIKAIFLGSEVLSEQDRILLEQFYHTRVVSWYGHSECVLNGGYIPEYNRYYFFPFYGYAELVDEYGKEITEPGKIGRIIGTSFDNFVMPFIRYDTGDLGVLSSQEDCRACYGSFVLRRIDGRARDIVFLSDGNTISITSFFFAQRLQQLRKIRELQLEQQAAGYLLMRIVKRPEFCKEDEQEIVGRLVRSVSGRLDISVVYVNHIPKTQRGKHIFFIQKINQPLVSISHN